MIDTYMDRASWPTWMNRAPRQAVDYGDPRYYNGGLYVSVTARMVAEARDNVLYAIAWSTLEHKEELRNRIPVGSDRSIFTVQGRRK